MTIAYGKDFPAGGVENHPARMGNPVCTVESVPFPAKRDFLPAQNDE